MGTYSYATEYDTVADLTTVYTEHASKDAAVRHARKVSGKDAPFGPTVYVLALLGSERVGHKVYSNGRCYETEGEGFFAPAAPSAA